MVLGGVEFSVGGWGEYESTRRREMYKLTLPPKLGGGGRGGHAPAAAPSQHYPKLTHATADDAVRSLMPQALLRRACEELAAALDRAQDAFCVPTGEHSYECAFPRAEGEVTTPPLTAQDVRDFAEEVAAFAKSLPESDPTALQEMGESVRVLGALWGVATAPLPPAGTSSSHTVFAQKTRVAPVFLPPLPARAVPVSDSVALLRLEKDVLPRVAALEQVEAGLAGLMDEVSAAIGRYLTASDKRSITGGDVVENELYTPAAAHAPTKTSVVSNGKVIRSKIRRSDKRNIDNFTRGEEVDRAVTTPLPNALMFGVLPFENGRSFSIDTMGNIVIAPGIIGPYIIHIDINQARETLLYPELLRSIAYETSGGGYAWVILESSEGRFALRMPAQHAQIVDLDEDMMQRWLLEHLKGEPPHKISLEEYLKYLRGLGFVIVEGLHREDMVRFSRVDLMSKTELKKQRRRLIALTQKDFDGFDWSDYDKKTGSLSCKELQEISGDVDINLETGKITVPKMRKGVGFSTIAHHRSAIVFHTHPSVRYQGSALEPPSDGDLINALYAAGTLIRRRNVIWNFVSAPEGTYILRPSSLIARLCANDWEQVRGAVEKLWNKARLYRFAPSDGVAQVLASLHDVGFVAAFHDAACVKLHDKPNIRPHLNIIKRHEYDTMMHVLKDIEPDKLLAADWTPVDAIAWSVLTREPAWVYAGWRDGKVVLDTCDSHFLHDGRYPSVPGPLFIVCYPTGKIQIKQELVRAVTANVQWAWCVILTPTDVLVFRVADDTIETHGPVPRRITTGKQQNESQDRPQGEPQDKPQGEPRDEPRGEPRDKPQDETPMAERLEPDMLPTEQREQGTRAPDNSAAQKSNKSEPLANAFGEEEAEINFNDYLE